MYTPSDKRSTVIPVDIAAVVGMTRKEFAKLPQGAKLHLARKIYQQQLNYSTR